MPQKMDMNRDEGEGDAERERDGKKHGDRERERERRCEDVRMTCDDCVDVKTRRSENVKTISAHVKT